MSVALISAQKVAINANETTIQDTVSYFSTAMFSTRFNMVTIVGRFSPISGENIGDVL
jgi:hypothetical protein